MTTTMRLLMTRKTLSVRFASICFAFMIVATSMMTIVLYNNGNNPIVEANAASADLNTDVDGSIDETITVIMDGVYYDSAIVSPDIYNEDKIMVLDTTVQTEDTEPSEQTEYIEPSESTESTKPIEQTESTEPSESVETIEPNRNIIDISLLKTTEYLPDYTYGKRIIPSVEIPQTISDTDMRNYIDRVDTSNYLYLGTYSITGYTPKCAHCCGNTKGITASGVEAIIGYTVATDSSIPFGTTLYIEGYGYYVVEDRGNLGKNVIDIAAPTHESCYNLTNYGVHVYVVPSTNNE